MNSFASQLGVFMRLSEAQSRELSRLRGVRPSADHLARLLLGFSGYSQDGSAVQYLLAGPRNGGSKAELDTTNLTITVKSGEQKTFDRTSVIPATRNRMSRRLSRIAGLDEEVELHAGWRGSRQLQSWTPAAGRVHSQHPCDKRKLCHL